jgi:integrase
MPKKPARVLGPYPNGEKFRLVVFEGQGRKSVVLPTIEEAQRVKEQILGMLADRTQVRIGDALDEFLGEKEQRGAVSSTINTLSYKLRQFLPTEESLADITPERAQRLYKDETQRSGRFGRPVAAATHRGLLRSAKGFFRWSVERGYLRQNPFEGVKPVGRVSVGKTQLRIDEARRLCAVLIEHAQNDEGAVAVLLQLMLGLRSSEVLARKVRDVDDDGRVLWIPAGKTKNARRRLLIPELLQPILRRLTTGAPPERMLIGGERDHAHFSDYLWHRVRRYCDMAGVPRVCPHSLRGLHSTLALEAGVTSGAVAAALGHGSFAITARHYADPDVLRNTTVRRVNEQLAPAAAPSPVSEPAAPPVAAAAPGAVTTANIIEALRGLKVEELAAVFAAVFAGAPVAQAAAAAGSPPRPPRPVQ